MQTLEIYQSLWGMQLRSPHRPERSDEASFAMIAEAGFDGMSLDPTVDEIGANLDKRYLFEQYDLRCMVNAFPNEPEDMEPLLDFANDMDASAVNVISGVMPLRPDDAVPVVRDWIGMAERKRIVVDRELRVPVPERDEQYIQSVLARSDGFQGRIANREQIQIQIDFPQHQVWVELLKAWWKDGFAAWRARNDENATLTFLCELGPPPYAITDAGQAELSDRWQETLRIRDWVREIWAELEEE